MAIRIVKEPIDREVLRDIAARQFGILVKAVVDVEKGIMAIGGELHADEEVALSEQGSTREDTWGINIYPDKSGDDWLEFDSMINIKPHCGNRSRDIESKETREHIRGVVDRLVKR